MEEHAPKNSLPTFFECAQIIDNDNFRKRAEAGLEGQVLDTPRTTPIPTALHRFIYEYDDADPYKSAWFIHRLEQVLIEFSKQQYKQLTLQQIEEQKKDWFQPDLKPEIIFHRGIRAAEKAHKIS